MNRLQIPADFPFTVCPNPHAAEAEARVSETLLGLGAEPSTALEWHRHDIGAVLALTFPDLAPRPLYAASLFSAFFWLFDDPWADRLNSKDVLLLLEVHRRLDAVLSGGHADPDDELCVRVLAVLMRELAEIAPSWKPEGFVREMQTYLQTTLWEVELRRRGAVPSLAAYLTLRPITGYWRATIEISGALCGITTEPISRNHPAVQLIDSHAGNYMLWLNDLCSYNREHDEGITANLIPVLAHEFQLSIDQAKHAAMRMCKAELDNFVDTINRLPALGAPLNPRIRRYLAHHQHAMAAAAAWMPTTERYA